MTDLHITDPEPLNDDIVLENSLRPSKFDEFIGQKELVDNLKLYMGPKSPQEIIGMIFQYQVSYLLCLWFLNVKLYYS